MSDTNTVTLGWWNPAGAGRVEIPLSSEQATRQRLYAQGCVVWREGLVPKRPSPI